MNKPGTSRSEFNKVPITEGSLSESRTLHPYIQAQLRNNPHDVDAFVNCPQGEDKDHWAYACFRQLLIDLNYYAYEHRDVSTEATEPNMEIFINGKSHQCLCTAHNPPKEVPAIDYITQNIDQATAVLLDSKVFPEQSVGPASREWVGRLCRRLYRIFMHSYTRHRDIFDRIEKETHICERFTKFALCYSFMNSSDICIPDDAFNHEQAE